MDNDVNSEKDKRIRFKEYRCIYPGCSEGLKTKYNCLSHIWDIHLRYLYNATESYKSLKDKDYARKCCLPYLQFVSDETNGRKRKPYDYGTTLNTDIIMPQSPQTSSSYGTGDYSD